MNKRAWIEINSQNLLSNLKCLKETNHKQQVMAVVKDNFYGLGIEAIKLIVNNGVNFLAVSTLEEAIELRENNITTEILILGYVPIECLNLVEQYNLIQTIISFDYAQKCFEKKLNIKYHLKINTGMNRLGINYLCLEEIKWCYQNLNVTGIFSHLLAADQFLDVAQNFNLEQINRYNQILDYLKRKNINPGITHLFNSAGSLLYGLKYNYDYVRPGIAFCGDENFKQLKPVINLVAKISDIKELDRNQHYGYGIENITNHKTKIATITIGYGDGLFRALANNHYLVEINQQLCPIIGRICMDQALVDVTNIDVSLNDIVYLLNSQLTIDKMAKCLNTIPNEIMTHLNIRLERFLI